MIRRFYIPIICLITFPIANWAQEDKNCPCCQEEYRQFDFWLGDWQTMVNGKIAGHNKIVLLQDSCVVQENWTSAGGKYTGTSYNYYSPLDSKWHQVWIDNQGQNLHLSGGLDGEQMILSSNDHTSHPADTLIHKITWTPIARDTVRQHWQSMSKDKHQWRTVFDGEYQRLSK